MCPPVAVNDTYADNPAPATDPSITVTTAGAIALDLVPTSSNGTFAKSNAGAFSVTTTNATGYTLTLKSTASNGTDLKNITNNGYVLNSLGADVSLSEADFSNSNNTQYNDKWGYLPSKYNSEANTTYRPAPSTSGDTIDVTDLANTTANDYSITLGARADYSTKSGSYANIFVIEATANMALDALMVNYNGNGLLFSDSSAVNMVKYDSSVTTTYTDHAYSHTSNINDNGVQDGEYAEQLSFNDTVTIAGASRLEIMLNYGIEEDCDYLYVLSGDFEGTAEDIQEEIDNEGEYVGETHGGTLLEIYTGGDGWVGDQSGGGAGDYIDYTTANFEVSGDKVIFSFLSDGDTGDYGYYAVVTGYDENDNIVRVSHSVYDRTLLPGFSYATPTVSTGQYFYGWGTEPNGFVAYTNEDDIKTNMPGDNGDVVNLYAIYGNCPPGKICYNSNNATSTTTMANQTIEASGNTTLWASNFWRTGYGFAGWNTKADGTGTNYGPNQDINTNNINGLTLYAKWIPSAGDLQGWTDCNSMSVGGVTALTDNRDSQTYAVAKLADGNCWMTENLRLADTHKEGDQTVATTINSNDTHNPASSFTALAASSNSWCVANSSSCTNQSKLNTVNTNNLTGSVSRPDTNIYAYGNYYNWYSATAGNGIYEVSSGNTAGDICPAGWSLPTGGNGGQFAALNTAVNSGSTSDSTGLRVYPANFVYSGYFGGSSALDRGSYGSYWSSTAFNSNYAYYLLFNSSLVGPGTGNRTKYLGSSVRCVLGS